MKPKALVDELAAKGIAASVYGPSMDYDGRELDDWLLVVGGEVVARGGNMGAFRMAVGDWLRQRDAQP